MGAIHRLMDLVLGTPDFAAVKRENNWTQIRMHVAKLRRIAFGLKIKHYCNNIRHQDQLIDLVVALNPHDKACRNRARHPICTPSITPGCKPFSEKRQRRHSGGSGNATHCEKHIIEECLDGVACRHSTFTAAEKSDAIERISVAKKYCNGLATVDDHSNVNGPLNRVPTQEPHAYDVAGSILMIRNSRERVGHILEESSFASADCARINKCDELPREHTIARASCCLHPIASTKPLTDVDKLVALIESNGTSKKTIAKITAIVANEKTNTNEQQARQVIKHARLNVTAPGIVTGKQIGRVHV